MFDWLTVTCSVIFLLCVSALLMNIEKNTNKLHCYWYMSCMAVRKKSRLTHWKLRYLDRLSAIIPIYCLRRFYSCLKFKSKMHLEPLKKLDKPCTALCNVKTILLSGEYGCDFRYKAAVTQRSLFHPRQYCSVGQRYRLMWLGNKR